MRSAYARVTCILSLVGILPVDATIGVAVVVVMVVIACVGVGGGQFVPPTPAGGAPHEGQPAHGDGGTEDRVLLHVPHERVGVAHALVESDRLRHGESSGGQSSMVRALAQGAIRGAPARLRAAATFARVPLP